MFLRIIDLLVEEKLVLPMDLLPADTFRTERDEYYLLFLFLSSAYRQGHAYIQVKEEITPSIGTVWRNEIVQEYFDVIDAALKTAFMKLDGVPGIVKMRDRLYFERSFFQEQEIIKQIARLRSCYIQKEMVSRLQLLLLKEQADKKLTQDQTQALLSLLPSCVGVVAGGPGTGKTHTAGTFLKNYLLSVPDTQQGRVEIALTGPTGKASQNLKRSIERAFGDQFCEVEGQVHAKTLHALLKLAPFSAEHGEKSYLPFHIIIVDEASMIDSSLMHAFLSRVKSGTQLLIMGDPDQLPPIEPGSVFTELVAQKALPVSLLQECLRCESTEILQLAAAVRSGAVSEFFHCLENDSNAPISLYELGSEDYSKLDGYLRYFAEIDSGCIRDMGKFRFLSPRKEGPFGSDSINRFCATRALKDRKPFVPVIIAKNDYELCLMNGEMGLLSYNHARARFIIDGKEVCIPESLLSRHELGFCLSVHKSQGSEFDHVVLFLPPGSEHFSRKLLYTAITRARKKIDIFADKETLAAVIAAEDRRLCGMFQENSSAS